MAHSVQNFRGKYESFNDFDLMVIIGYLLEEVGHSGCPIPKAAIYQWKQILEGHAPGAIDLGLQHFIDSDSRQGMLAMLQLVKEGIGNYGDFIPASVLNAKIKIPGVVFHDFRIGAIIDGISRLSGLLADRDSQK